MIIYLRLLIYKRKSREFFKRFNTIFEVITYMKSFILNLINYIFTIPNSKKSNKNLKHGFEIFKEKISLKDDAFHGAGYFPFTEWWYFDASFSNNYSASMAIRIIGLFKIHICIQRMDIYKKGKKNFSKRKAYFHSSFFKSNSKPILKIKEKKIMEGFIDKKGNWTYNLFFDIEDTSARLKYVGKSEGWKSKVPGSMWSVILPRAEVSGTLIIDGEKMDVKGSGYHDHNWNVRPSTPIFIKGWFWGRFTTKIFTFIWSNVIHSKKISTLIFVINQENKGYIKINQKDIKFTKKDFKKSKNKKIPRSFNIKIDNDELFLDVKMKADVVTHTKVMGFMNYFRYHMVYKGTYKKDDIKENIDDFQIAELLQFF